MSGKEKSFSSSSESITALGLTQPPIYWSPGIISLGIKRRGA